MQAHAHNITDTCIKLKRMRGENTKVLNIPEIKTFLGTFTGKNVFEGFRANPEHLCNEKSDKNA